MQTLGELDGIDRLIVNLKFVINFIRNHGTKPCSLLRTLNKLSMLVWSTTRFGTVLICTEKVVKLKEVLCMLVLHRYWVEFLRKQWGEAKVKVA